MPAVTLGPSLISCCASSSPLEGVINAVTVALRNSPINAGKKALAKAQAGEYDAPAVRAKVEALIADNAVMVFSWSGCPFCKSAKALLDSVSSEGRGEQEELARGCCCCFLSLPLSRGVCRVLLPRELSLTPPRGA